MCGENEYYSECGDDSCQPTCPAIESMFKSEHLTKAKRESCHRQCSTGACICKPEYVRNSEGKCILPESCRENYY